MKIFLAALMALTAFASADDFPISYWCGPTDKFTTLERYQEIKDAGFTFVMPPCCASTPELNLKILDLCKQVGLKAFVADSRMIYAIDGKEENRKKLDGIVSDYAKHPALLGYYIVDEPAPGSFPGLGEVVAFLKERDPKRVAFINLLPNYAPEWAIGKSYEQYLRSFAEKVKPAMISYDHYGFAAGDVNSFFANLDVARKVSGDTQLPFWNIVLCVQHGPYRNLTEGELRFEAMQTLAYGGKGLLWFTYWSPALSDNAFKWQHAMIDENGKKDPHYDMIKAINADVQAIGSELMKAKSTRIYPISVNTNPERRTTMAEFQAENGKTLMLFANQNYKQGYDFGPMADDDKKIEQLDIKTRKWIKVEHHKDVPIKMELLPGGAVLWRW